MDGTVAGEQGCWRGIARQMAPSSASGAVPGLDAVPVLPYLGIELEPVLHVIPEIRLSSSSGSGSGQFIRSRRTLASHREKGEPGGPMGGEQRRRPRFRRGCRFIGVVRALSKLSSARLGLDYLSGSCAGWLCYLRSQLQHRPHRRDQKREPWAEAEDEKRNEGGFSLILASPPPSYLPSPYQSRASGNLNRPC